MSPLFLGAFTLSVVLIATESSSFTYIVSPNYAIFKYKLNIQPVGDLINHAETRFKEAMSHFQGAHDILFKHTLHATFHSYYAEFNQMKKRYTDIGVFGEKDETKIVPFEVEDEAKVRRRRWTLWEPFTWIPTLYHAFGFEDTYSAEEKEKNTQEDLKQLRNNDIHISNGLEVITDVLNSSLTAIDQKMVNTSKSFNSFLKLAGLQVTFREFLFNLQQSLDVIENVQTTSSQHKASKHIISVASMNKIVNIANSEFKHLHPVFPTKEIEKFYDAEITKTTYDKISMSFMSKIIIPMSSINDEFFEKSTESTHIRLSNEEFSVAFSETEFESNCHRVSENAIVCGQRPCQVKNEALDTKIHSCSLNTIKHEVEIVLGEEQKNLNFDVKCQGKKSIEKTIKNPGKIIKFNLSLECKAENDDFFVDQVRTFKAIDKSQEKTIDLIDVELDDFEASPHVEHILTKAVAKSLLVAGQEAALVKATQDKTHAAVGISGFSGLVAVVGLCLACWKFFTKGRKHLNLDTSESEGSHQTTITINNGETEASAPSTLYPDIVTEGV